MSHRRVALEMVGLAVALSVAGCAASPTILNPAGTASGPVASSSAPDPARTPATESVPPSSPPQVPLTTEPAPSATSVSTPPEQSADMDEWTLTTAGWGPVRMGSTLPGNLRGQLKPSWECVGPIIKDRQGTERMEFFTGRPEGSGRINTLHIVSPDVATRSGIRRGDSLTTLKRTYPKLQLFRAKDGVGGLTGDVYILPDDEMGLFFEMQPGSGTVEHISVQQNTSFYPFQLQICGAP